MIEASQASEPHNESASADQVDVLTRDIAGAAKRLGYRFIAEPLPMRAPWLIGGDLVAVSPSATDEELRDLLTRLAGF
jgi:hypothetical protein